MFCGQLERVEHLFLLCPFARAVWDTVKEQYQVRLCRKNLVNLKHWLAEFLQRENEINATVLAVTSWLVWEARNEYMNNGIFLPPVRVATRSLGYVDMILNFLFKEKVAKQRSEAAVVSRWSPPPENWVCINVDAALFSDDRRMGGGVIIRDHAGKFLLSCSEGMAGLPAPEMAETIAARRGLSIAKFSRGLFWCLIASL